ncbi:MAG: hypothetical protein ACR2NZ_16965 [Rubripirellula sp.]
MSRQEHTRPLDGPPAQAVSESSPISQPSHTCQPGPTSKPGPTDLLARLLTDRHLRERFVREPAEVAAVLTHDGVQREFLLHLDRQRLVEQAESLIRKRQHEVAGLVPSTWASLGTTAVQQFRRYVDDAAWPAGHRRHQQDAFAFCEFLRQSGVIGYAAAEERWLRFQLARSRCRVGFVADVMIDGRPRYALQVFLRDRRGQPHRRHFFLRHWRELTTK